MVGFKVLIVDQEEEFVTELSAHFKQNGLNVITVDSGKDALQLVKECSPEFIIISTQLPDANGISICKKISRLTHGRSLVFLMSASKDEFEHHEVYLAGGIDFLIKPLSIKILILKLLAYSRRIERTHLVVDSSCVIYKDKQLVKNESKAYVIPKMEFKLLELLMSYPKKVFSRAEISKYIWGTTEIKVRNVDMHVHKLRSKIGEDKIITIKGVGYKYDG